MSDIPGVSDVKENLEAAADAVADLFASGTEIIDPAQFVNPQSENIASMGQAASGVLDQISGYKDMLNGLVPPPGNLGDLLSQADQFQQGMGTYQSMVDHYSSWTDFLSGKLPSFPASLDTGFIFGKFAAGAWVSAQQPIPFIDQLEGLDYANLLGTVSGAGLDGVVGAVIGPGSPCIAMDSVMGAVTGKFNDQISVMVEGMASLTDGLAAINVSGSVDLSAATSFIASGISQVEGAVASVAGMMGDSVSALAGQMVSGTRKGLAKLMVGLTMDPCMKQVLGACCNTDLKATLGV